jgi:hypothetical protein
LSLWCQTPLPVPSFFSFNILLILRQKSFEFSILIIKETQKEWFGCFLRVTFCVNEYNNFNIVLGGCPKTSEVVQFVRALLITIWEINCILGLMGAVFEPLSTLLLMWSKNLCC